MDRLTVCSLAAALLLACLAPAGAHAQRSCEDLARVTLSDGTTITATSVAANTYKPPFDPYEAPPLLLPAFCRVQGIARPTSDSEIRFELWLPAAWNGKFEQVGNGGLAGKIPLASMGVPLLRGYAVAATDDGHSGSAGTGDWALGHPQKVIDFAWRAVHETSVQSKAILQSFYGKPQAEAYFVGCSEGGREALLEAQRFPADFNGIVAGAPASVWVPLMFREAANGEAMHSSAAYIPPAKLAILQKAALDQCDALDGLKDGLIENPQACHFDPAVVQCKDADGPTCLTALQVEAARKIYNAVPNSITGAPIAPGYSSPGTEAVPANWPVWITGEHPGDTGFGALIANAFFANFVFEDAHWDPHTLNYGADFTRTSDKFAALMNATGTDLSAFRARGGKLLQYHGWSDAAIPALFSVNYFNSVQSAMGSTADFYRLFLVPGMSHCGGGIGANVFGNERIVPQPDPAHDIGLALDQWVTHGIVPDRLIATGFEDNDPAKPAVLTRPLCPYPQQARYKGSGDPNSAASFRCQSGPPPTK